MRFRLIDAAKEEFPVQRLCEVLGVSQSGYFAWRGRPACRRQREDMVLLAHLRSAFALSNGTYGSPRMTRELQDDGLKVGHHRQSSCLAGRAEHHRSGLRGRAAEREVGSRHLLCLDPRRMAVSGRRHRPLRPPCRRLGGW